MRKKPRYNNSPIVRNTSTLGEPWVDLNFHIHSNSTSSRVNHTHLDPLGVAVNYHQKDFP